MSQYLQLSVTTDAGFDQSHSGPGQKPVGGIAGVVLSEGRGHSRATGFGAGDLITDIQRWLPPGAVDRGHHGRVVMVKPFGSDYFALDFIHGWLDGV
jgi:hypothetical protein